MNNDLLKYYNEELRYLRQQGDAFANLHPNLAGHLRFNSGENRDPFVARLIESFAFLSARIKHKLDDEFNDITQALLDIIYPHYLLPVPACSILQFTPNSQLDKPHLVPRHTPLVCNNNKDEACHFHTVYPSQLLPIHISDLQLQAFRSNTQASTRDTVKTSLKLNLQCNKADLDFASLKPDVVRFYINAELADAYLFYTLIFQHVSKITLKPNLTKTNTLTLPQDCIRPVGFDDIEGLLPYPAHSFSGYRLLTEAFCYPRKFMFFEIKGLAPYFSAQTGNQFELEFYLDQRFTELDTVITPEFLKLNCTPIINLFELQAEPVYIDHTQTDYHLVPDAHRPAESIEVYRIQNITCKDQQGSDIECIPYFGNKHKQLNPQQHIYWHAKRKPCWECGMPHTPGTETFLNISENDTTLLNKNLVLSPNLLCTNRNLPSHLSRQHVQFNFWNNNDAMIENIQLLHDFSTPYYRSQQELSQIDLIAHLSTNQINLSQQPGPALATLQEVLALYSYANPQHELFIRCGLTQVTTRPISLRHPTSLKYGLCQGIEYVLHIDESYFPANFSYFFGNVLARFLTKSCSVNSFVRLHLHSKQRGEILVCQPQLGNKSIL